MTSWRLSEGRLAEVLVVSWFLDLSARIIFDGKVLLL